MSLKRIEFIEEPYACLTVALAGLALVTAIAIASILWGNWFFSLNR